MRYSLGNHCKIERKQVTSQSIYNSGIIKRIIFFCACLIISLLECSCEKTIQTAPQPGKDIAFDFNLRYPGADIVDVFDYDNKVDIYFKDSNWLNCTAVYVNDIWIITEKSYDVGDFLFRIPRKVARAYIETGIENENYQGDNSYFLEVARKGIDKKQYEFNCVAHYTNGSQDIENLVYDIIIDEDGTLLSCSHGSFNRSICWYDISTSMACVRNRYRNASILGAVNDGGNNVIFIRDNDIIKTVTTRDKGFGFEWVDTRYPLDINTVLPESTLAYKKEFEAKYPDKKFYALSSVDCPEGLFYCLTFGTEINNATIYSKAE
ncbi:MAG: hypothetical protein PUK70_01875 [Bacteroidales bacterium]|nr:hypothetical protein [Bacteroidales bacterium]